jgi:hypothetical protein
MSHTARMTSQLWHEEYRAIPSHSWTAKLKHAVNSGQAVWFLLTCVFGLLFLPYYMVFELMNHVGLMLIGSFWQLLIWIAFICWLAFYRYPLFDVLYPMVQAKVSINNMAVYTKLIGPTVIRIIRLEAGSGENPIVCNLITGSFKDLEFEALSYVWGVGLFPYTTQVDCKPFFVTSNLHAALQGLRLPQQETASTNAVKNPTADATQTTPTPTPWAAASTTTAAAYTPQNGPHLISRSGSSRATRSQA